MVLPVRPQRFHGCGIDQTLVPLQWVAPTAGFWILDSLFLSGFRFDGGICMHADFLPQIRDPSDGLLCPPIDFRALGRGVLGVWCPQLRTQLVCLLLLGHDAPLYDVYGYVDDDDRRDARAVLLLCGIGNVVCSLDLFW